MAAKGCLILTVLDLERLATSKHGIYQRFQSLVVAALDRGHAVTVVAPAREARTPGELAAFSQTVQRDLQQHWNVEVRVIGLPLRPQPDLPWSILELGAALRFKWTLAMYRSLSPEALRILAEALATELELVIAHRLPSMVQLLAIACRVPVVLDLDDIEHLKLGRTKTDTGSVWRRLLQQLGVASLRAAEARACRHAASTLVCSEVDQQYLSGGFRGRFVAIPNAVAVPDTTPGPGTRPVMLMVGIYSYAPNADGAAHFIRNIFPRIRQRVADAEVWFVGRGDDTLESALHETAGVRFLGFQDDLAPVYAQARLSICPILAGGGTRIKIIEAGAFGIPCVSTNLGAEGLELVDGTDVMIADDADLFADRCVSLLTDAELARQVGAAARLAVETRFSRSAQIRRLAAVFMDAEAPQNPH